MINYSNLKVGDILSETSYYVVKKVGSACIIADNSIGIKNIELSKTYVEQLLASANQIDKEEKLSQTEIISILMSNPRTACSVYFQKQDTPKTKKAIKEETAKWVEEAKAAFLSKGIIGLEEFATNPVKDYIPGEMRLIKGYHTGSQDERGRLQFVDMEDTKVTVPKAVDTRTIEWVIVNNVKYIKK